MDITLGHDEDLKKFGDLALIFKVTAEPNTCRSNVNVCGGGQMFFLKTILVFYKVGTKSCYQTKLY